MVTTSEKIRQSIDMSHIEKDLNVSISIGLVNARDRSLQNTLLNLADKNLYQAKVKSNNQIIYN